MESFSFISSSANYWNLYNCWRCFLTSSNGILFRGEVTLGFREGNICEVVTIEIDGRFISDPPVAIEDKTTWSDFCGIFKRFSWLVGFCPSTVVPWFRKCYMRKGHWSLLLSNMPGVFCCLSCVFTLSSFSVSIFVCRKERGTPNCIGNPTQFTWVCASAEKQKCSKLLSFCCNF